MVELAVFRRLNGATRRTDEETPNEPLTFDLNIPSEVGQLALARLDV